MTQPNAPGPWDVVVIGGGPSGALAARQLATRGHRVLIVASQSRHPVDVQHLTASAGPALQSVGLLEVIERAAFARPEAAVVAWDTAPRFESHQRPGWLIQRSVLDPLLLAAATAAGASVVHGRALAPQRSGDTWHLRVRQPRGATVDLRSTAIVDAHGASRRAFGVGDNMALCCTWSATPPPIPRVEALDDGWLWGAPAPGQRIEVVACLDRCLLAGRGRLGRLERLRELLGSASLFRELASPGSEDTVVAVDAWSAVHPEPAAPGIARVGAAALSLDPIASQGLQVAFRSALHGAATIATMLEHPERTELAVAFHTDAVHRAHRTHQHLTRESVVRAAAAHPGAYWHRRVRAMSGGTSTSLVTEPAGHPPSGATLTWSPAVAWRPTPVLDGPLVHVHDALHHPAIDGPVAFIGTLPVGALRDVLPASLDDVARHSGVDAAAAIAQLARVGAAVPVAARLSRS